MPVGKPPRSTLTGLSLYSKRLAPPTLGDCQCTVPEGFTVTPDYNNEGFTSILRYQNLPLATMNRRPHDIQAYVIPLLKIKHYATMDLLIEDILITTVLLRIRGEF